VPAPASRRPPPAVQLPEEKLRAAGLQVPRQIPRRRSTAAMQWTEVAAGGEEGATDDGIAGTGVGEGGTTKGGGGAVATSVGAAADGGHAGVLLMLAACRLRPSGHQ
jgi:hypothetical protein